MVHQKSSCLIQMKRTSETDISYLEAPFHLKSIHQKRMPLFLTDLNLNENLRTMYAITDIKRMMTKQGIE